MLAGLAWAGGLTVPVLLGGTFLPGVAAAFTNPGWAALMPEIIGRAQMPAAVALGAVGINLARAIGPLVGGLLVAATGPGPVFALNAVSFLGIAPVALLPLLVKHLGLPAASLGALNPPPPVRPDWSPVGKYGGYQAFAAAAGVEHRHTPVFGADGRLWDIGCGCAAG